LEREWRTNADHLNSCQKKLKETSADLAKSRENMEQNVIHIEELQAKLHEKENSVCDQKTRCVTLSKELSAKEEELDSVHQELNRLMDKYKEKMEEWNKFEDTEMDLLAEVQSLKDDNRNLHESLSQKEEHCNGLNDSNASLEEEMQLLSQSLHQLQAEHESCKEELKRIKYSYGEVSAARDILEVRYECMTKRLEEALNKASSLEEENKELRVLKEDLKDFEARRAKLKSRHIKLKRGLHEVEVQKAKIKVHNGICAMRMCI
jgi:chromosome segregation ATPase